MKVFPSKTRVQATAEADMENLRAALDKEREIASAVSNIAERSIDGHLAAEFNRHVSQIESQIARLEDLLQSTTRAAA